MKKIVAYLLIGTMVLLTLGTVSATSASEDVDEEKSYYSEDMVNAIRYGNLVEQTDDTLTYEYIESYPLTRALGFNDVPVESNLKSTVRLIALEGDSNDLLATASFIKQNNGSVERSDSDNAQMVTITTKIDYTRFTNTKGDDYYAINKVTGTLDGAIAGDYLGSNVYIASQYVTVKQSGVLSDGGGFKNLYKEYNPAKSAHSWTLTFSDWKNYPVAGAGGVVNCWYEVTLKRGSGTWKVNFENSVI